MKLKNVIDIDGVVPEICLAALLTPTSAQNIIHARERQFSPLVAQYNITCLY